jgi:hypothetical protein
MPTQPNHRSFLARLPYAVGTDCTTMSTSVRLAQRATEESKVEPRQILSSSGPLEKRARAWLRFSGIRFFKGQALPHSGEDPLLRWFWSFTGASGAVAARSSAAPSSYGFPLALALLQSPP